MDMLGYAVVVNMPGYMPDNPPAILHTVTQARAVARDEAKRFREDGYHVTGNMKEGYYCEDDYSGFVISIDGPYDYPQEAFDD